MTSTDDRPWLLDLFCGAGGAGEGYRRAGFHVVGVDIDPKPLRHNPHECYQDDALVVLDTLLAGEAWQRYRLHDFDAIHASPPCQGYSRMRHLPWLADRQYTRLIDTVWERLGATGLPWIIENVEDAPMPYSAVLCGVSFGLNMYRHRRFGSSHLLFAPSHRRHTITITPGPMIKDRGRVSTWERAIRLPAAMGCPWMTQHEVSQAIPPAYTLWIGRQLMTVIDHDEETRGTHRHGKATVADPRTHPGAPLTRARGPRVRPSGSTAAHRAVDRAG